MSDNPKKEKARLRRLAERRRAGLTASEALALSRRIQAHLLASPLWTGSRRIHCYVSCGGEVDTLELIQHGLTQDREVWVPRLEGREMRSVRLRKLSDLVPSKLGIPEPPGDSETPEPTEFDLILVPCIAFDTQGHRLGRGWGCYDRFLARHGGRRIGLAFACQIASALPAADHDVRLDGIMSESGLTLCATGSAS